MLTRRRIRENKSECGEDHRSRAEIIRLGSFSNMCFNSVNEGKSISGSRLHITLALRFH